ncbi:MAG TPA: energy transducer TonB [Blastocatellia bacterium]|jgi:TonB family protein|nr:energy transducer TonB [Blastocatellia bacterium]
MIESLRDILLRLPSARVSRGGSRALLLLALLALPGAGSPQVRERPLRIAVIGLSHPSAGTEAAVSGFEDALEAALGRDGRAVMTERSLMKPALAGVGYDGSINMSTDEARRVGAAIGCDFFMIGMMDAVTRSDRAGESHEEAVGGLMMVDGRTGALAAFDFIQEKAASREAAAGQAKQTLVARSAGYIDRLVEYRARLEKHVSATGGREPVEDLPNEDSPRFTPPRFANRIKPEYPSEANRANVGGTVEAMAVFRANGEVGDISITRWAGFGMEESAIRAIRELKFTPATLDGRPVSVRALVRYNFRKLEFVDASEPAPNGPEPDLRKLFKRGARRPPF